jgi:23S rRNA pseudouridine1911/1915/1917 synthase
VLDIRIETGRTHQIRVHLSSKKLPIIGDKTYDPSRSIARDTSEELINIIRGFPRQALHATHLSFNDQKTNNIFSFDIPTPNDMEELLLELRKLI